MPVNTTANKQFVQRVPRASGIEEVKALTTTVGDDQNVFALTKVRFIEPVSLLQYLKNLRGLGIHNAKLLLISVVVSSIVILMWKNPYQFVVVDGLIGGILLIALGETLRRRRTVQKTVIESIRAIQKSSVGQVVDRSAEGIEKRLKELRGSKDIVQEDLLVILKRAGVFSEPRRQQILYFRKKIPELCVPWIIFCGIYWGIDSFEFLLSSIITLALYLLPVIIFTRIAKHRVDEIRYSLPFLAQQMVITTSSGIDVGASLQQVYDIAHARTRGSILINHISNVLYRRLAAGLSLSEALTEEAEYCGVDELKQFFSSLAATTKNGTEIYRSMSATAELAETMRFLDIESRVRRLPVLATGPLFCVFAGFFMVVTAGLFTYVSEAMRYM